MDKISFERFASAVRFLGYCGVYDMRIDESRFDAIVEEMYGGMLTKSEESYYENFGKEVVGKIDKVTLYNLGHTYE